MRNPIKRSQEGERMCLRHEIPFYRYGLNIITSKKGEESRNFLNLIDVFMRELGWSVIWLSGEDFPRPLGHKSKGRAFLDYARSQIKHYSAKHNPNTLFLLYGPIWGERDQGSFLEFAAKKKGLNLIIATDAPWGYIKERENPKLLGKVNVINIEHITPYKMVDSGFNGEGIR